MTREEIEKSYPEAIKDKVQAKKKSKITDFFRHDFSGDFQSALAFWKSEKSKCGNFRTGKVEVEDADIGKEAKIQHEKFVKKANAQVEKAHTAVKNLAEASQRANAGAVKFVLDVLESADEIGKLFEPVTPVYEHRQGDESDDDYSEEEGHAAPAQAQPRPKREPVALVSDYCGDSAAVVLNPMAGVPRLGNLRRRA